MKKVLITTSSFSLVEAPNGFEYVLNPYKRKLTTEELTELVKKHEPDYIIAGTEKIDKAALEVMKPFVKMISRCGVGMDNVDLNTAKELGIAVTNTPDAPTMPVAELTLGIMLDLLRKISFSDRTIRSGGFEKPAGNLLHGKTVGIIGCGRIGTHLAKLLEPFDCIVLGYDKFIKTAVKIEMTGFDKLIEQSDIISLHIPFSAENKYIINAEVLNKMKNTAYLLNISRGGLVDENALNEALKAGKIAGAGVDCFENEPYKGKLTEFDNVVLTSHIGSYAKEARVKQELDAVANIKEVL
jgi:D-3-phosphoglycerate dehydrogenase